MQAARVRRAAIVGIKVVGGIFRAASRTATPGQGRRQPGARRSGGAAACLNFFDHGETFLQVPPEADLQRLRATQTPKKCFFIRSAARK